MPQKSLKTAPKNKSREDSTGRRGGPPRKSHPKCECLECSLYQSKFKPDVHPCPNFKKKKMAGSKKTGKVKEPKKVITSRWIVPPKFDSQRTFPRCRCLGPSGQVSSEQLENSGSASSRASSVGGKESKPIYRDENERNLREDFYDALKKQAEKTSGSNNQFRALRNTQRADSNEFVVPLRPPSDSWWKREKL
uniref:Orotate phosphoribosyltransferase n=1 Tax=Lygus hesperus TaxID=30085 RepID=A0A0A9YLI8_LYGHE